MHLIYDKRKLIPIMFCFLYPRLRFFNGNIEKIFFRWDGWVALAKFRLSFERVTFRIFEVS